jgi:RHS repeat-associated protein
VDDQRRKSVFTQGSATTTRYYLDDYEEVYKPDGTTQKIHYLSGGSMMLQQGAAKSLYYGYHDYQGSLIAWTNQSGTVVERRAYDPWGRHRNPQNWTEVDYTSPSRLNNRGYTGHEHLDASQIINMNGRVYDPLTAQFFSPDPFVQAPDNWLNYNRYAYCLNNPLIYTDPDGEWAWLIFAVYGAWQMGLQAGFAAEFGINQSVDILT